MNHVSERISAISNAVQTWLEDHSGELNGAIDQAVEEEGHLRHDIFHRLQEIERTVTEQALTGWAEQASVNAYGTDTGEQPPFVLCLHAGNLPLVGLQDILAVLLSGNRYWGKISKKDYFLMESLLKHLWQNGFSSAITWSMNLDDAKGEDIRAVMFSGSEKTIPQVWKKLHEINCESPPEHRLVRTASYSIAWMERCAPKDLTNVWEAILRYQGQGCRSVKAVVSPLSLDEIKKDLELTLENYMGGVMPETGQSLRREIAFARASGKTLIPAGTLMIRSEDTILEHSQIIPWIEGDKDRLEELAADAGETIQNIYLEDDEILMKEVEYAQVDLLPKAQSPPITWKPDGVDPLNWLIQLKS